MSLTVLTTFTFLVAYSFLLSGARADIVNSGDGASQVSNEILHKRRAPAIWLKTFPVRGLKPLNSYSVYRRDLQPSREVEFLDDTVNNVEKKFDDYGHMR